MSNTVRVHADLDNTDLSNVFIDTEFAPDGADGSESRWFDGPDVSVRDAVLSVSVIEAVSSDQSVETDVYLEQTLLDPERLLDLALNPLIALHKAGHAGEQFPAEREVDAEYMIPMLDVEGQCGTAALVTAHRCDEEKRPTHREIEIAVRVGGVVHGSLLDLDAAREFAKSVLTAIATHEADMARSAVIA